MKRIFFVLATAFLAAGIFAAPKALYDKNKVIKDTGKKDFNATSVIQTVSDMKTGWNLGNTFDATGGSGINSETSWGQPKTTREMIDALSDSGIKTIRIPVSWARHIDKKTYTIDPDWMKRVKTVVDWAIDDGMYVIINSHHDNHNSPKAMPKGNGYYPNSVNLEESKLFLHNIWSQIATTFNNGYDEHLIFETMNEPRLVGTNYEWWNDLNSAEYKDASKALNELNQTALDAIRSTKGNNLKRYVMIPGLRAAVDSALAPEFQLPKDKKEGQLILSVHMYDPYPFAMDAKGTKVFSQPLKNQLATSFKTLNERYVTKGVPVIIGEYGATNKNNLEERVGWFEFFLKFSRKYGITSCLWDNGSAQGSDNEGERFGYFNRRERTWYFPEIITAINKTVYAEEE